MFTFKMITLVNYLSTDQVYYYCHTKTYIS